MASLSYLGLADESGGTCWAGERHPGLTLSWGATSRMVLTPTGGATRLGSKSPCPESELSGSGRGLAAVDRGEGCRWGRLVEGRDPAWRKVELCAPGLTSPLGGP